MRPADDQAVERARKSMRLGAQMARDRILEALRTRVIAISSQIYPAITRDDAVEAQTLATILEMVVEDERSQWP